ncbi:MAG TPA: LysE family transporter [Candidatus Eisenbacteria bacterium]
MDIALAIAPILAVLAIGVISPGPSFILVGRTAVAVSRRAAVASAFGMALGATLLAIAALFGLNAIFQKIPAAFLALKIGGGLYLLYLAVRTWRSADKPIALDGVLDEADGAPLRHFGLAIATMLSNPKAAIQYGVIFAAMLPKSPSLALSLALPPSVFLLEVSWYLVVAFALSADGPRGTYLRARSVLDRVAGAILGLLGIKLILSSR